MLMLRSNNPIPPRPRRLSHKIEASRYESYPQPVAVFARAALALGIMVSIGIAIALIAKVLLA
jgi:hypothetical protein